jgi:diadenosine tetraphosphate (Ap4A) HIT family hydrolase
VPDKCGICRRIARFTPDHPYVVAELETGYAVLGDNQVYRGYTIFLAKRCVAELHLLPSGERATFLREMSLVAEAVFRAFAPRKLNYELLGNSEAHLHWHLIPRYAGDPNPTWPVWNDPEFARASADGTHADRATLDELRPLLRREIDSLRG